MCLIFAGSYSSLHKSNQNLGSYIMIFVKSQFSVRFALQCSMYKCGHAKNIKESTLLWYLADFL